MALSYNLSNTVTVSPITTDDIITYKEQLIGIEFSGLKPVTLHKIYVGNVDVSDVCTTITAGNTTIISDDLGTLTVQVPFSSSPYDSANLTPSDYAKQQITLQNLISVTTISAVSLDGTSTAFVTIKPPEYNPDTPTFDQMNTTSLISDLNIVVNNQEIPNLPSTTGIL